MNIDKIKEIMITINNINNYLVNKLTNYNYNYETHLGNSTVTTPFGCTSSDFPQNFSLG